MMPRPISSLLLYMQVFAVWALILVAAIFTRWNDSDDQLITILLFGAGAIIVPVYQLVMRSIEDRKHAKFVATATAHSSEPSAQTAPTAREVVSTGSRADVERPAT